MIPYPKYPKSNAIIHILSLDGQQCQIISESERVLHTSVTFDKLNRQINQMSFKTSIHVYCISFGDKF